MTNAFLEVQKQSEESCSANKFSNKCERKLEPSLQLIGLVFKTFVWIMLLLANLKFPTWAKFGHNCALLQKQEFMKIT